MSFSYWLYQQLQKKCIHQSPKHYLHLCIRDAYQRSIKIPFYQREKYVYEEFNSSTYLEKMILEIYRYEYVVVTVIFKEEDEDENEDEEEEEEIKKVKFMLSMKENTSSEILTPQMLSYYKYVKIAQKYAYYTLHTLFYLTYLYYALRIIQSSVNSYSFLWILPLFHWMSEKIILFL